MKPDYGLDAPQMVRRLISRGIIFTAIGVALYVSNRTSNPAGGKALFSALGCIGGGFFLGAAMMIWSSRVAKLRVRDRILESIPWRGDEKVLDVGCGRGLMLIGAAKRLTTGKATGIDIWRTEDLSGNSADAAKENARTEEVLDRVRIENIDARKMPFPDNNFDVVLSSLAIHNIADHGDREKALGEMLRVLKPGGRLAIFDILHTGDYAKFLADHGAKDLKRSGLSLLWCMPTRWLVATK